MGLPFSYFEITCEKFMQYNKSITKLHDLFSKAKYIEARNLVIDLTSRFPSKLDLWKSRVDLHFHLNEIDAFRQSMARLHYLHPDAPRFSLPRGHHGLGEPGGAQLAVVDHDGG